MLLVRSVTCTAGELTDKPRQTGSMQTNARSIIRFHYLMQERGSIRECNSGIAAGGNIRAIGRAAARSNGEAQKYLYRLKAIEC
jgi:hypothetical protein